MSVLEDGFKQATKDLDFSKQRDRVRGCYVRRRALKLVKQNPGWDALKLTVQLMREQAIIMGYLTQKMQILLKGPDPTSPGHLDLADISKIFVTSSPGNNQLHASLEKEYRTNRSDWIWQIVWRALAIHDDDLWKNPTSPTGDLETEALDEILDRRLRAVEQMHCNVNSGGQVLSTRDPRRVWVVKGANGPWTDGVFVRNFEYPFLPKAPFKDVLSAMSNWKDVGEMILFEPQPSSTGVLNQANIRFAKSVGKSWLVLVTPTDAWPTFQPSGPLKHGEVFKRMFTPPRENFFDRNWLYCDFVSSAVTLEALELGIQRRPGDHPDFETMMNTKDYVRLGPVVRVQGESNYGILMSDDQDAFFENTFIDVDDLQIGDFVCFWNNQLYDLIASGAWRNEYSLIMGIDASESSGKVRMVSNGPQIWLSGHGLATTLYSAMATELITNITSLFDDLRSRLSTALASNSALPTTLTGQTLVQWSPYEDFDTPGAWWIKIPKDIWNKKWAFKNVDDVVKSIRRTVAKEAGGTGYHAPPDPDAVYFPLFEPQVAPAGSDGDSWHAYLQNRKAKASFRPPSQLKPLTVDGRLAPGLFYSGAQAKIPVVRPKVRK